MPLLVAKWLYVLEPTECRIDSQHSVPLMVARCFNAMEPTGWTVIHCVPLLVARCFNAIEPTGWKIMHCVPLLVAKWLYILESVFKIIAEWLVLTQYIKNSSAYLLMGFTTCIHFVAPILDLSHLRGNIF